MDSFNSMYNNKTAAIFSGDSDRDEVRVTMDADDDKSKVESLHEITVKENSKYTYNINFISFIFSFIPIFGLSIITYMVVFSCILFC